MTTKRQDILDAAARVFLRDGFSEASTKEIAREAKVSSRTLYKYFRSKTALYGAITAYMSDKLTHVADKTEYAASDPYATLLAFARDYLEIVLSQPGLDLQRMVIAEAKRFPDLGLAFLAAGNERTTKALANYLSQQNALGTLNVPEPKIAADQFQGFVLGSLRMRAYYGLPVPGSGISLERWIDSAVTIFLRGCGYETLRNVPSMRSSAPPLHRGRGVAEGRRRTLKKGLPKIRQR